jgi:hypothetical protein
LNRGDPLLHLTCQSERKRNGPALNNNTEPAATPCANPNSTARPDIGGKCGDRSNAALATIAFHFGPAPIGSGIMHLGNVVDSLRR